ncbi:hypothetical protein Goarm_014133 [Gossypium armourianum]|uniref:DUF4283 domain-containing protein n=1 Tax=Gossypium armourianum TaxID=34283 RepID=A0A7J9J542_9ROSI|nr:hypothetical protein [Gossypium armourianum]
MEDFDKGKKSFKEILMVNVGNKGGGTYAILKNEDLDIVEDDLRFLLESLYPKIFFSDQVQEILGKNVEQTLVVKLLGRLIGYKAILNRIQVLWKPVKSFQVIDIDNDYFLVKFSMNQYYTMALTKGP